MFTSFVFVNNGKSYFQICNKYFCSYPIKNRSKAVLDLDIEIYFNKVSIYCTLSGFTMRLYDLDYSIKLNILSHSRTKFMIKFQKWK